MYKVIMRRKVRYDNWNDAGMVINLSWSKIKKYGVIGNRPSKWKTITLEKEFNIPFEPFKGLELCKVDGCGLEVSSIRWESKNERFVVIPTWDWSNGTKSLRKFENKIQKYLDDGWTIVEEKGNI